MNRKVKGEDMKRKFDRGLYFIVIATFMAVIAFGVSIFSNHLNTDELIFIRLEMMNDGNYLREILINNSADMLVFNVARFEFLQDDEWRALGAGCPEPSMREGVLPYVVVPPFEQREFTHDMMLWQDLKIRMLRSFAIYHEKERAKDEIFSFPKNREILISEPIIVK